MTQTDAQAALAAAAQVIAACAGRGPAIQDHDLLNVERHAIAMASAFLDWLRRPVRTTVVADERLVPNEDFRAPGQDRTVVINPNDVTFAAAERERTSAARLVAAADPVAPWRTASGEYTGPHVRGGPAVVTPSGAYACLCGEKWPCSQSETERRRRELSDATQVFDTWERGR